MMSQIATALCLIGVAGLFALNRDRDARTSRALWIPVIYLLIIGSRPVSVWLGISPVARPQAYIYDSPFDAAILVALLLAGLMVLISRGKKVGRLLGGNGPVLLFFSYAALSVLWSDYPFVTLKHWVKGVEDAVMVLVALSDPEPKAAIKRLLARTGFLLIPFSLLLAKYYPGLGRLLNRSWTIEYTGVATQKNQLGVICLVFGLASLWRFLTAYRDREDARRSRRLMAHGALLAIVVWLLVMSNSITSLVCLGVAGAVMVLASRPSLRSKPAVVHLLAATGLGISLLVVFSDPLGVLGILGRNATLTGRTAIWDALPGLVQNRLAGSGYESFLLGARLAKIWTIRNGALRGLQEAHNGYLEVYLNLGWIGVSLFALLMLAGYRRVVAALPRDPQLGSLSLGFFVAAVIYSLTEAGFRMQSLTWIALLWAVMGASQPAPAESTALAGAEYRGAFSQHELATGAAFGEDAT